MFAQPYSLLRRSQLMLLIGLCALHALVAVAVELDPSSWIVENVQKDLELHGSVSQAITKFSVKAAGADPGPFIAALSAKESEKISFLDAVLEEDGNLSLLDFKDEGLDPEDSTTSLLSIDLPRSKDAINFQLRTAYNHISEPLPKVVGQTERQYLRWNGDIGIRSFYKAAKGRVKVITSTPNIQSYTPKDGTKSTNRITFGPYEKIPSYRSSPVKQGSVHYEHNLPVASVVTLDRVAEVSHWGDNLAIEDRIWLRNDGPALKGHFSRIDYQKAAYLQIGTGHILSRFPIALPPGARDAYFIDQIGNVSTSRFAGAPPRPADLETASHLLPKGYASTIEIQPRYPVLGGWNYTFSLGWNMKLGKGGWGRVVDGGFHSIAVPFLTAIGDAFAVDQVRTTIVLPEGATDISTFLPFEVDRLSSETYTTYLDTTGRPSVVIEKARCADKHAQLIYIQYKLSPLAHLRKPIAVTTVVLGLFTLAAALRRFEPKIKV